MPQAFPSSSTATETLPSFSNSSMLASRPLFSRLAPPQWVLPEIFSSKALRLRRALASELYSWLAKIRETSRSANYRRALSPYPMHLTLPCFHARVSLFIKVESAQRARPCVQAAPCSWCLIAMTSRTMPHALNVWASPAAFRANAITRRLLHAKLPHCFGTNRTRTAPPPLAHASETKLASRELAIYSRTLLGNRFCSPEHF